MNILKSLCVFVFLLTLLILSLSLISRCGSKTQRQSSKRYRIILALCCSIVTIGCIFLFGDYIYPFERTLQPVLIAEVDVPEEYELQYPGQKFWHGAYKKFGLYAESFYFDPDNNESIYGFGWPPMDFDRYCYVITYGQKIAKLSYNVWETIDIPIRTGSKVGHMVLDDAFYADKVYIYRIPKIRIENDINSTMKDRGRFA